MREILFRGKWRDTGEWAEGSLVNAVDMIDDKQRTYIIEEAQYAGYGEFAYVSDVDLETVGQYTGLTDKNGKKVFEGDIVKGLFLFGSPVLGVVAFKDGAFGLAWKRGEVDEFSAFTSICNVEYEIIGNIHDNPELLEGGADK